jgi:hypothetical protein
MVRSGDTGVNDWMFTRARECLADAGGAADAKPSTLDLKVKAIPELWPDWVSWDEIPAVTHDQVGRSAGRQVGKLAMDVTRPSKSRARGLSGVHPGGDACFGPRRATNTHHKLPNENSAQIPRVWLISHLICLIYAITFA